MGVRCFVHQAPRAKGLTCPCCLEARDFPLGEAPAARRSVLFPLPAGTRPFLLTLRASPVFQVDTQMVPLRGSHTGESVRD